VEQLTAEKQQLNAAYNDALAALRQLLTDSREMHALLKHTNTYCIHALLFILLAVVFQSSVTILISAK